MKVQTTRDVNLRFGSPSTAARQKGVIMAGFELEVEPVTGESHEGVSQWYRDKNGDFIWGGGVARVIEPSLPAEPPTRFPPGGVMDWCKGVHGLPQEWVATKGAGIKVAVLDSGLDFDHRSFPHVNRGNSTNVPAPTAPASDNHPKSHGTHCAGFVGARSIQGKGVLGLAPEATILVGRVMDDTLNYDDVKISKGIDWAVKNGAHVISMSLGLFARSNTLDAAIGRAVHKKVVLVAAAGDNRELSETTLYFPAHYENCIGVGAADQSYVNESVTREFVRRLDYVMPFQDLWSCVRTVNRAFDAYPGSSMSTALMSGIVALLLSHLGFTNERPDDYLDVVRREIDRIAIPLLNATGVDSMPLKIMKPKYQPGG